LVAIFAVADHAEERLVIVAGAAFFVFPVVFWDGIEDVEAFEELVGQGRVYEVRNDWLFDDFILRLG
jgi:hypothetical protein